jgi:two-component system sensor histidine kinase HydH
MAVGRPPSFTRTLSRMDGTSARARDVEHATQHRFFDLFVRVRFFAAPVLATVAAVAALEGPLWRSACLLTAATAVVGLSTFERFRYREHGELALGMSANLLILLIVQAMVITCTGGLASPLMPGVVGIGIVAGLFGPDAFTRRVPLLLHVPWLGALAWVQTRVAPESFRPVYLRGLMVEGSGVGAGPWVAFGCYALLVLAAPTVGRRLRGVIVEAYADVFAARERELDLYRSQRAELTALTGELAHDLKNPLASLVGLGTLLQRELGAHAPGAKARDHLRVLRKEVDRMRVVVDELLDFSRPVVPVDLKEHDVAVIVQDVVALHEGARADRSLDLRYRCTGDVVLACDERKIRSLLVNLLQNAIEASPVAGIIELRCEGRSEEVRIICRDSGPGLDTAIAERALEPGVTTKATGSGLGLTIARTLVEQHGGTLELANDGGLVVTVTLPRRPGDHGLGEEGAAV